MIGPLAALALLLCEAAYLIAGYTVTGSLDGLFLFFFAECIAGYVGIEVANAKAGIVPYNLEGAGTFPRERATALQNELAVMQERLQSSH